MVGFQNPLLYRISDALSADMIPGQDSLELAYDITATLKPDAPQVRPVANTKVVEWREQAAIESLPKTHFISDAIVEPMKNVLCVGALRGRG